MRAYISHTFNPNEYYILTVLSSKLSEYGFVTSNSLSSMQNLVNNNTYYNIINANLFIGVVTANGKNIDGVMHEWNIALENKIPSVLLLEDNIQIQGDHPNIIRFNKHNPGDAINLIQQKRTDSVQNIKPKDTNNTAAWIIGGAIALLSLIALLSPEEEKKGKNNNSKKKKLTTKRVSTH